MSDPTNDIDALLRFVNGEPIVGTNDETEEIFKGFARALTALVAERDALLAWRSEMSARHAHLGQSYTMLAEENAILRERLKSQPPADRDRELRERDDTLTKWMDQVTAMLCHSMTHAHDTKQELVTRCDAAIAAMQKGGGAC